MLATKAELLQRFHRARSMLMRLDEEEVLLPVEAERGIIYFEACVAAIREAIAELEAPIARPEEPSADWARADVERAGRVYKLGKHLTTYEDLLKRARMLWSKWAPNVQAPVGDEVVDDDVIAVQAENASDGDGDDDGDFL